MHQRWRLCVAAWRHKQSPKLWKRVAEITYYRGNKWPTLHAFLSMHVCDCLVWNMKVCTWSMKAYTWSMKAWHVINEVHTCICTQWSNLYLCSHPSHSVWIGTLCIAIDNRIYYWPKCQLVKIKGWFLYSWTIFPLSACARMEGWRLL